MQAGGGKREAAGATTQLNRVVRGQPTASLRVSKAQPAPESEVMPIDNKDSEPKPKWIGEKDGKWDLDFEHWSCPKNYQPSVTNNSGDDVFWVSCMRETSLPNHFTIKIAGSE
jgi:hypothetical protein